ncbi:uncharacterized protein [Antedon mediterranea]|uniref:uncharacterized protein n=1 Tax=Antedon mediterranea TaxID=105859 RepID=UPI003AF43121
MDAASMISGASSSSSSSARVRASAKKAAIKVRLARLQEMEKTEAEELRVKQKKNRIEQETLLAEAEAEAEVYEAFDTGNDLNGVGDLPASDVWWHQTSILDKPINDDATEALLPDISQSTPQDSRAPITELFTSFSQLEGISTEKSQEPTPVWPQKKNDGKVSDKRTEPLHQKPKEKIKHYIPIVEHQSDVIKQEAPVTVANECDLSATFRQLVDSIRLPPIRVDLFNGDPLKFPTWLAAFNSLVEAKTCSNYERLSLLAQHLAGEPKALVANYLLLQTEEAYVQAKNELKRRYGHPSVVATALITKLNEWPKISAKDNTALRKFSDFICEVAAAKMTISDLGVLDYPQENMKLVSKLPYYLENKWRSIVSASMDTSTFPSLERFSEFLKAKAKEANIPMFQTANAHKEQFTSSSKRACATLPTKVCNLCKNPHEIAKCKKFIESNYERKLEIIKNERLCFGCLRQGHRSKECRQRMQCGTCKGKHPTILHQERPAPVKEQNKVEKEQDKAPPEQTQEKKPATVPSAGCSDNDGVCTMAIIPVIVKSPKNGRAVTTYVFLDPGSSVSFCTDRLRNELGLGGRKAQITLDTMGTTQVLKTHIISNIVISNLNGDNEFRLPNIYSKNKLPVTKEHIPTQDDVNRWDHLRGRVVVPEVDGEIGLMLGNAVAEAYTPLEVVTGPPGSPYASKTALGWIPWSIVRQGVTANIKPVSRVQLQAIQEYEQFNNMVKDSVNIDFPDRATEFVGLSVEDRSFMEMMDGASSFVDGHYVLPLPWRSQGTVLPDNRCLAMKRFNSLERRFERDLELRKMYNKAVNQMVEKGYMEEVIKSNTPEGKRIWYIPHHPISNERKPGKIRVVFDCAAKCNGVSLNDVLLQGPDLTNSLIGVLMRFREDHVAVMADIEGMFLQVVVPEEDRDSLRFYWRPSEEEDVKTYRMTRHLFGATSSPACANKALLNTAADKGSKYCPDAAETMKNNFYVDDCLVSVKDHKKALTLVKDLTLLCEEGGFRLTKWMSNDKRVLNVIPKEDHAPEVKSLDLRKDKLPSGRALGIQWSPELDTLRFTILPADKSHTRRGVLSIVSSVFDPLGLVAPFVLPAKILLQDICRKGLEWDEPIDDVSLQRWKRWLQDLARLDEWSVPRCYKSELPTDVISRQLHVFADASNYGYGMAAYIRQESSDGHVQMSLVMGRSRVAPLKYTSIPRLELTAAVMASRLANTIISELSGIDNVFYWTDSQTVLKYIHNTSRRFKAFVANRVSIILNISKASEWRYVRTCNNPADEASRGQRIEEFLSNTRWRNGPEFLRDKCEQWIDLQAKSLPLIAEDDPEIKGVSNVLVPACTCCFLDDLITKHSSYGKIKRIVAWLLVAVEKLCKRVTSKQLGNVRLQHLRSAECMILAHEQRVHFKQELEVLKNGNDESIGRVMRNSPLKKLDPLLLNGMITVGGRLNKASLPDKIKHPVVVHKNSLIARLIIVEIHKEVGHLGRSAILSQLWQRYWIIGASSLIRSVISRCVVCQKHRARASEQKMASLPPDRIVSDHPPFHNTGIDLFGPFEIKLGRSLVKRYGVIFTCLSTRAIHLEMAYSLITSSFINTLRRFIARRGQIKKLRSDNGTNFVGADKELKKEISEWNTQVIHMYLQQRDIEWEFNPPGASHFGGVWERMIRTVRQVMKGVLKEQNLKMDDEGLQTLFCEVEMIVNNRPITTLSTDPNDFRPLTPAMLLTQREQLPLPPGVFDKRDIYARRYWRQVQYLSNLFWQRWRKEYLPTMQERQKWFNPKRNLEIGDIVLVVDNSLPRNSWLLGRIVESERDNNGLVRSCTVKTQFSTLNRPIAKLCLLVKATE